MEIKNNVIWTTFVKRTDLKEFQWKLKHEDAERNKMLQNRIKKWFDAPMYVWHNKDNLILDGHQRLKALNVLAEEWYTLPNDEIPVIYIVADSLIEAKEKLMEYNSSYADFDIDEYALWIADLDMRDIFTGIDLPDIDNNDAYDEDIEDEVPPIPEIPIVQYWDIFKLGNHVIMCGDTTREKDVKSLMSWNKADMVWTDPPYNVDYKWHWKNTKNTIKNDNMNKTAFQSFLIDSFKNIKSIVSPGAWFYFRHNHKEQITFEKAIQDTGMEIKHQLVRNKPSLGLWWWDYRPKHELCFYCASKGIQNIFYWDRCNATVIDTLQDKTDAELMNLLKQARESEKKWRTTIFSISRDNVNEYVHPTQKPVELCWLSVLNNSKKFDIIFDGFLWSGVAVITAEKFNRRCYGMELDPRYIQVILRRYYEVTKWTKDISCINRKLYLKQIFI